MSKTPEQVINEYVGISTQSPPLTPMDKGECIRCMQEYASLQNAELQRENESLRKQLHEHNGICQEKLSEQLNSVLPEIKLLKEQNAELLEVIKDLGRFIPSLRFVVDNGFQSPENCLAVIDRIESLIEKYTDKN